MLLTGLARQDFTDFEVVLVDALYHRRRELVADRFAQAKIRLTHTPPRQRLFPVDGCPQARNAAIAKARGDLLLWLVDYTYAPPGCLREHWGIYEHFERARAGMGAHRYLAPPALAYTLPEYAPIKRFAPNAEQGVTYQYCEADSRQYAQELDAGVYDTVLYSLFHPPLDDPAQIDSLSEDPFFFQVDPKLHGTVGGDIGGNFFHAKNEGTALAWCLRANGFDERYTGHLYDDTDFGWRLEHAGAKWVLLDASATVRIVNPRHFFPHLVRQAPLRAHLDRYEQRRTDPEAIESGNAYQLRDVRQVGVWYG